MNDVGSLSGFSFYFFVFVSKKRDFEIDAVGPRLSAN